VSFISVGAVAIGNTFIHVPDQQAAAGQPGIVTGKLAVFHQEKLPCAGMLVELPVHTAGIGAQ